MKSIPSVIQTRHRLFRGQWRRPNRGRRQTTAHVNQKILIGLMAPMMVMVLNIAMFGVALPTIRDTFAIRSDVTAWLVTVYLLPFMVFMPLYGRLGDGLGKRRLLLLGTTVFVIGTAITLSATNLSLLILGRVIQGIGTAGINPLCLAIISERFPIGDRGKAMGTWNSVGPLGAIAGPILAGFLTDHWGWHTIFWPILLVGVIALLAVWKQIPGTQRSFVQPGYLRTFDWGGVVLLGVATTSFVFYVSSRPITGVEALRDWRLLSLSLLLFGGFILWEKRVAAPYIQLELIGIKNFSRASFGAAIRMFTMSGSIGFLMPLYLTDIHALSAAATGATLMLHAGALLVTMRIGGQLADRWHSSRRPIVFGSLIQMGMMVYFALLPGTAWLGLVIVGLVAHGLGAGLSLAAFHRSSMSQIPREQTGMAAGLYSMIRFGGTILGVALAGVILQQGFDRALLAIEAYQVVFWFAAVVALLGVVIGWGLRE